MFIKKGKDYFHHLPYFPHVDVIQFHNIRQDRQW